MADPGDAPIQYTTSSPTVVRRVYKIQYKPQPAATPGQTDSQKRRMSMKAYDRNTDNDIFKLGSAFKSGNFDVDEFLKSLGSSGTAVPAGYTVEKVETSTNEGDDGTTTVTQIKALTPTSDSGEHNDTGHHGWPGIVQRRRIITTLRKGKDDDDDDDDTPNDNPPAQPVIITRPVPPTVMVTPETDPNTPAKDSTKDPNASNNSSASVTRIKPPLFTLQSITEETTEDEILDTKPADRPGTDVSVDVGETISSSDEEIHLPWRKSLCPGKKPRMKKRRKSKAQLDGHKGARAGMAASEVTVLGQEMKLPAIQKLVLNYSKMLDMSRDLFIETMFRAVKLNGLDVVKILCQLVMRKNIPLGSDEMREPESSATVLHVALLYNHENMIEYLVGLQDRDLLMATYTKEEYKDQTALHVAVANGNLRVVKLLLQALSRKDKKRLMNTVATGTYFSRQHPEGQLCLSAAAWSGNTDILILLAKHGASFALANLQGNTLLHRIILSSTDHLDQTDYRRLIDKVYEAVGEWAKHCKYKTNISDQRELEQKQKQINTFQKLLKLQNNDGITPLTLAAKRGSPLLLYLINMEKIFKIPQTKLGSIAWMTYDVTDISSFAEGSYNKFSVLHVLAHHSGRLSRHANLDSETSTNILDSEPIKSLIDMKWSVYRWIYIAWCLTHLGYILLFTYFTFDDNSLPIDPADLAEYDYDYPPAPDNHTMEDTVIMYSINYWLVFFIILPVVYIILEFIDWFGNYPYSILFMRKQSFLSKVVKRIQSEWVITGNGPYRFVGLGYSVSAVCWFGLYVNRSAIQEMALSTALLLGWIFVLFFTRGCRVTSRFSIMIQKMFFRDLMYFLAVYVMILAAFSFAINAMYSHLHLPSINLPIVMYHMMNIVTDLHEKEELKSSRHPLFTKILLMFYAIVAVILLMNMLIAMMNTSYETVRITRCNIWKQQQLSIMLMMERRLFWCHCLCSRSEQDVWQKDMEEDTRAYLDVTTTQHHTDRPQETMSK